MKKIKCNEGKKVNERDLCKITKTSFTIFNNLIHHSEMKPSLASCPTTAAEASETDDGPFHCTECGMGNEVFLFDGK